MADIQNYLEQLEPCALGHKTRSSLWIEAPESEQQISVSRCPDYQVTVNFCPETRAEQERKLFELYQVPPPSDELAGTWIGEDRCGYARTFRFNSATEAAQFLRETLRVVGLPAFQYAIY